MAISSKNQNQQILAHLVAHGYITQLIATNYGVRRLASRMYDLKLEGVRFEVETRRDDTGVKYAYYTMSEIERADEKNRTQRGISYKLDDTALKVA